MLMKNVCDEIFGGALVGNYVNWSFGRLRGFYGRGIDGFGVEFMAESWEGNALMDIWKQLGSEIVLKVVLEMALKFGQWFKDTPKDGVEFDGS
jgi:hypothetical protein